MSIHTENQPHKRHEQTINIAMAACLEKYSRTWKVDAERVGIFDNNKRVDILVTNSSGWPIAIEAEITNSKQAENEARSRINEKSKIHSRPVEVSVALVYGEGAAKITNNLTEYLEKTKFRSAILISKDSEIMRIPRNGWVDLSIKELVLAVERASLASHSVDELADVIQNSVQLAEARLSQRIPIGSSLGLEICSILNQPDDERGQTRRMMMTVICDALIFQEQLAVSGISKTVASARAGGSFIPSSLIDEWEHILGINFWPIFYA